MNNHFTDWKKDPRNHKVRIKKLRRDAQKVVRGILFATEQLQLQLHGKQTRYTIFWDYSRQNLVLRILLNKHQYIEFWKFEDFFWYGTNWNNTWRSRWKSKLVTITP